MIRNQAAVDRPGVLDQGEQEHEGLVDVDSRQVIPIGAELRSW